MSILTLSSRVALSVSLLAVSALAVPGAASEGKPKKQAKGTPKPVTRSYEAMARRAPSAPLPWRARPLLVRADGGGLVAAIGAEVHASEDGGRTWARRGTLGERAEPVAFGAEGDRLVALLRSGALLASDDGGGTWAEIEALAQTAGLADAVVEGGSLDNGGAWALLHAPAVDGSVIVERREGRWRRVAELAGRAHATSRDPGGWSAIVGNALYRSTPDGTRMVPVATLELAQLNSLVFVDEAHGWIAADQGMVIETRNGGREWLPRPVAPGVVFERVLFADPSTGWAVGQARGKGVLLATHDGGANWRQVASGAPPLSLPIVAPDGVGWLVDGRGVVLASKSSGFSWQMVGTIAGLPEKAPKGGEGDPKTGGSKKEATKKGSAPADGKKTAGHKGKNR